MFLSGDALLHGRHGDDFHHPATGDLNIRDAFDNRSLDYTMDTDWRWMDSGIILIIVSYPDLNFYLLSNYPLVSGSIFFSVKGERLNSFSLSLSGVVQFLSECSQSAHDSVSQGYYENIRGL